MTFNEGVTGVAAADFAASGTSATLSVAVVSASVYDVTLTGGDLANLNGTVGLNFSASPTISDLAGNALPNTEPTTDDSFTVDTTAPTADIVDVMPDPRSTNAGTVTITFSESVSGVDVSDFGLTRDGNAVSLSGLSVSGSGTSYTLNLSSVTETAGAYVLTLTALGSRIQDAAGNVLASNSSDSFTKVNPIIAGTLDTTFDDDGLFRTAFDFSVGTVGTGVALQADGKIVIVGSQTGTVANDSDFSVVRLNANGGLDPSFGGNGGTGRVLTPILSSSEDTANDVLIQPDGKILVGGSSLRNGTNLDFALTRYLSNGMLDNSFDQDGKVTTGLGSNGDIIFSLALQADGKIVAAGQTGNANKNFAVVRYDANGGNAVQFQTTDFGSNDEQARRVLSQADGKILVVGESDSLVVLARYMPNGQLDPSFGSGGKVRTNLFFAEAFGRGCDAALQSDGKIVVAGIDLNSNPNFNLAVLRLNPDGLVDQTFGVSGRAVVGVSGEDNFVSRVQIQNNGEIVVVGTVRIAFRPSFSVTRLTKDGQLDDRFNGTGRSVTDFGSPFSLNSANAVAIQDDGKILVAGESDGRFAVARFLGDPAVSLEVSPAGVLEDGAANLDFTFTRTGDTSAALTVDFDVSTAAGAATLGTDYVVTGADSFSATLGSVTFAAGSRTATVTVNPTPDDFNDRETVQLTLRRGENYLVRAANSATGAIVADEPANVRIDGMGQLVITDTDLNGRDDRLAVTFLAATATVPAQVVIKDTLNALTTTVGTLFANNREVRVPLSAITTRRLLVELNGGNDSFTVAALPITVFTLGVSVQGGLGNDTLTGGAGSETLSGDGGNDSIVAGAGDDVLIGGAGIDTLDGGAGTADRLEEFSDGNLTLSNSQLIGIETDVLRNLERVRLTGGATAQTFNASAFTGNVTLIGSGGDDVLIGGGGADLLSGGDDNDLLTGGAGADILQGDGGSDKLVETGKTTALTLTLSDSALTGLGGDVLSDVESAQLTGSTVADTLNAQGFTLGSVTLLGLGGKDVLIGGSRDDSLDGGDLDDVLTGNGGVDTLNGGGGLLDTLVEGGATQFVLSIGTLTGLGTDTIMAIEQARLTTAATASSIDARQFTGRTTLTGGAGNDTLLGGSAADSILGGAGDDVLSGGGGNDSILGGAGNDIILGGAGDDSLGGSSKLATGDTALDGNDTIFGGTGTDSSTGKDRLFGGLGNDILDGGDDNDTLTGDGGIDSLFGGAGTDSLSAAPDFLSPDGSFTDAAFFTNLSALLAAFP